MGCRPFCIGEPFLLDQQGWCLAARKGFRRENGGAVTPDKRSPRGFQRDPWRQNRPHEVRSCKPGAAELWSGNEKRR